MAKRLPIPIFHVNAEDPGRGGARGPLAVEYRYRFGSDVVIDLIGYRRHGHSEVDDPDHHAAHAYRKIKEHPPLYEIYAQTHRRRRRAAGRAASRDLRCGQEAGAADEEEASALHAAELLGRLSRAAAIDPPWKWRPASTPRRSLD